MRRLTTLILLLAFLAAVIATPTSAATESDVAGEDDASVTPVEWNARALQYAQAQPANLEQAVKLFHRAFTRERRTLRRMRRRLRELLEREDREWQDRLEARIADGEEVDEDDNEEEEVESPGARALRDQIRLSKARMAEYLNNEGVALMRQSKLHGSRRVLTHALKLQPDHRDATNNLAELERLVAGGTRAIDGNEEPPRHQRKSAAAERRAEKRRRYESGEDDHESPKKKKAEEEEEEEEEPKPKKKKAKSSKKKAKKQPKEEAVDDTDAVYTRPAKRTPQREPEPAANMHEPRKKRPTALDRKRRPNTNPRMKLPRVHIKHLHFEENVEYANGRLPFILIGALDDWDFAAHWSIPSFAKLYSSANVDFYPHNMEKSTVRPYMTPLPKALQEQANPTHAYPVSDTHPGSYIQWNVNWRDWSAMSRNMGAAGLPSIFRQDDPWLTATSDECFNSHELQDEFTLKTHWRMVLIGNRGAGMFNHQDVLRTSSYQAQVAGSKRWHLCAPSESQYIGRAGGVDAFDPDYATYPLFAKARCYDDIVETGEMIFYPADYWHQTENIETPTISVTATVMDANNVQLIIDELDQECRVQKFKWGFTPQLCHALQQKCFAFWRKLYQLPTRRDEL